MGIPIVAPLSPFAFCISLSDSRWIHFKHSAPSPIARELHSRYTRPLPLPSPDLSPLTPLGQGRVNGMEAAARRPRYLIQGKRTRLRSPKGEQPNAGSGRTENANEATTRDTSAAAAAAA